MNKDFEKSVFVNCPFDEGYKALLLPLLFTIHFARLKPRIALEASDSGSPRISKILEMIKQCKYGIHDLSRCQASKAGEYFRLNMPFELGLDVGCKNFGRAEQKNKKCLILESEKYRYQAALSDLSNSDILNHDNNPETMVYQVRNWLEQESGASIAPASYIWGRYLDFMSDNDEKLNRAGYSRKDIERQPVKVLMSQMKQWIDVFE